MKENSLVKFLIGGVQKSGTTALYSYLNRHPSLGMAACKEVHFFDRDDDIDWNNPDYNLYHSAFDLSLGKIKGEATPIYLYWPKSLERIYAYNPDMRLIFLFRDPISRAYSHWKMETARGFENEPFSWAIRSGRSRVNDLRKPGHHRVYSYVERGFYAAQLLRVYDMFPRNNVLLLSSDDLANNPNGLLLRVHQHIGVDPQEIQDLLKANVGPGSDIYPNMLIEDRKLLREIYSEDMAAFTRMSGISFKEF